MPAVSGAIGVATAGAAVRCLAYASSWRSGTSWTGRAHGATNPSAGSIAGHWKRFIASSHGHVPHESATQKISSKATAKAGAAPKAKAKAKAKGKAKAKAKAQSEVIEESGPASSEGTGGDVTEGAADAEGQSPETEEPPSYSWDEEPEPQPPYGKAPGWKRNMTDAEWEDYYSKLRKWRYRRTGSEERWIWNPKTGVQWFIGDLVEAKRPDRGNEWCAGRVARNHGDSTFTVKWDEDGEQYRAEYKGMRKCRRPEDHPLPDWIESWWPTERDWDD